MEILPGDIQLLQSLWQESSTLFAAGLLVTTGFIWWCITCVETSAIATIGYGISFSEAGTLHHHLRGGAGGSAATAGMKSMREVTQQLSLVVAKLEGGERPEDEVFRFVTQLARMVSQWQASPPTRNELKEGLQKIINEVGETP